MRHLKSIQMRWDRPANSDALGLVADHFRGLFLISDTWAILGAQAYTYRPKKAFLHIDTCPLFKAINEFVQYLLL